MKKVLSFVFLALALVVLPQLTSAEATPISQDALIVGSGKLGDGILAPAVVSAYDINYGTLLSSFTAYDKNLGVRVASGDVDGDGNQEIVTLPWKQFRNPVLKVFDLNGQLETSNRLLKKRAGKAFRYDIAVGDVNADGKDEIVLTRGAGKKLGITIVTLKENGKLELLSNYKGEMEGYRAGAWVEVSEIGIITGPIKGEGRLDLWQYDEDQITHVTELIIDTTKYNKGLHMAASGDKVYTYVRNDGGVITDYTYNTEDLFTAGELSITNVGDKIGDLTVADSHLVVSSWYESEISIYNAEGVLASTIPVDSQAVFLNYLDL